MLLQPGVDSGLPGSADPVRSPILTQQHQCGFGTAVVEGPFQCGEVFQQLGLETVDRPYPVRGLVGPPGGQEPPPCSLWISPPATAAGFPLSVWKAAPAYPVPILRHGPRTSDACVIHG